MKPSDLDLSGKVAVVTGGAYGIGGGAVMALAGAGADIVIGDINEEAGTARAEKVRAAGRRALFVEADAMKADDLRHMIDEAGRQFGRIDILVNNAGGVRPRNLIDQNDGNWTRVINLNMVSLLAATQAAAKVMIAGRRGGAIVNVASTEGLRAAPGFSVYAACKAAMISFTKTMALELGTYDIRVNCIAPDLIDTPGLGPLMEAGPGIAELRDRMTPLRRMASVEEAGNVILFLASPMSSFVTGVTLPVDGGMSASAGWSRSREGVWGIYHPEQA